MEEESGRRGIPSLLKSLVPSEIEGASLQQEHIASDITQLVGWTPLIELKRIAEYSAGMTATKQRVGLSPSYLQPSFFECIADRRGLEAEG